MEQMGLTHRAGSLSHVQGSGKRLSFRSGRVGVIVSRLRNVTQPDV